MLASRPAIIVLVLRKLVDLFPHFAQSGFLLGEFVRFFCFLLRINRDLYVGLVWQRERLQWLQNSVLVDGVDVLDHVLSIA